MNSSSWLGILTGASAVQVHVQVLSGECGEETAHRSLWCKQKQRSQKNIRFIFVIED